MKTVLVGICSILFLASMFYLFNRNLKHARTKTSLYLHRSELDPVPTSKVMETPETTPKEADAEWGEEI